MNIILNIGVISGGLLMMSNIVFADYNKIQMMIKKKNFQAALEALDGENPKSKPEIYTHNFLKALALHGSGKTKEAAAVNMQALEAQNNVAGWYNAICFGVKLAAWEELPHHFNNFQSAMIDADKNTREQYLKKLAKDPDWDPIRSEPLVTKTLDGIKNGFDSPLLTSPGIILKRAIAQLKKMDPRISDVAIAERQHWNPARNEPRFINSFWYISFYGANLLFDDQKFALSPHARQFAKKLGDRSSLLANAIKDGAISHAEAVKIVNGYMEFYPPDSVATFGPLELSDTKLSSGKSVLTLNSSALPTSWEFILDSKTGRVLKVSGTTEDRSTTSPLGDD